jgi:hypothetical protein
MKICDRFLDEHDILIGCADPEHRAALARRAAGAPSWGQLVREDEGANGFRDYLDGEPIHCGAGLELQAIEYRSDDYGEYVLKLPTGVRVRYELDWPPRGDRQVVLHAGIAGHEFTARHETWMRFRWPPR